MIVHLLSFKGAIESSIITKILKLNFFFSQCCFIVELHLFNPSLRSRGPNRALTFSEAYGADY